VLKLSIREIFKFAAEAPLLDGV